MTGKKNKDNGGKRKKEAKERKTILDLKNLFTSSKEMDIIAKTTREMLVIIGDGKGELIDQAKLVNILREHIPYEESSLKGPREKKIKDIEKKLKHCRSQLKKVPMGTDESTKDCFTLDIVRKKLISCAEGEHAHLIKCIIEEHEEWNAPSCEEISCKVEDENIERRRKEQAEQEQQEEYRRKVAIGRKKSKLKKEYTDTINWMLKDMWEVIKYSVEIDYGEYFYSEINRTVELHIQAIERYEEWINNNFAINNLKVDIMLRPDILACIKCLEIIYDRKRKGMKKFEDEKMVSVCNTFESLTNEIQYMIEEGQTTCDDLKGMLDEEALEKKRKEKDEKIIQWTEIEEKKASTKNKCEESLPTIKEKLRLMLDSAEDKKSFFYAEAHLGDIREDIAQNLIQLRIICEEEKTNHKISKKNQSEAYITRNNILSCLKCKEIMLDRFKREMKPKIMLDITKIRQNEKDEEAMYRKVRELVSGEGYEKLRSVKTTLSCLMIEIRYIIEEESSTCKDIQELYNLFKNTINQV